MSLDTLAQAALDPNFRSRVQSCVVTEAFNGSKNLSSYAKRVRDNPESAWTLLLWPCAINGAASYQSGVLTGLLRPDLNVSDAEIVAAVQGFWPEDEV